jgi:hypothetical protein
MPGMAARERERRRNDEGENDSEERYDYLPFHETILNSKAYDVNVKL